MGLKKLVGTILVVFLLISTYGCFSCAEANELETKKIQTRNKINRLKVLERLETNKLYKNQQKLESATINLQSSKNQIVSVRKELSDLESKLNKASTEYNNLNYILAKRIRSVYKNQRNVFLEVLLTSEDINTFFDRIYYQKKILRADYVRMAEARSKAKEIAMLKYSIESKKNRLERSVASINLQQNDIERAIQKNKVMINKLQTDRVAYEKAEKELARQSASIGSYINKQQKNESSVQVASGFMKPIQGRITSPFGWRTHPIFKSRSFHSGVDIGGPNYGAIRASNSGKVIYAGWYGGYGKVVIVEHGVVNGKPITTLYAHMSSIKVANGTKVQKGQILGLEGTTGYSTGPHCHFEVRVNGQPNNPLNYI
ncbi:MAG: peptidoglycan DD-metalloendopeptidase family protein [bacterium]|nr:peptidoglycan DD-metalloendopeptidase family protein [bacterium]